MSGDPRGRLWWTAGLHRFNHGELDTPDGAIRRLPDGDPCHHRPRLTKRVTTRRALQTGHLQGMDRVDQREIALGFTGS